MTPTHDLVEAWQNGRLNSFRMSLTAQEHVPGLSAVPREEVQEVIEEGLSTGQKLFTIAQDVVELSDEF